MRGKIAGIGLVLLMLIIGVAVLLIGFCTWIFIPDFPHGHFFMGGLLMIGLVLTNVFVELVPWQKTKEILFIGGSLLVIGLAIIVTSASTLGQSPTTAQSPYIMFIGGGMAYTGVVMCAVSIADYYRRKTPNKIGDN